MAEVKISLKFTWSIYDSFDKYIYRYKLHKRIFKMDQYYLDPTESKKKGGIKKRKKS